MICVYVPNSGSYCKRLDYRTKEWDLDLISYVKKLQETKPVIVAGDMNVSH